VIDISSLLTIVSEWDDPRDGEAVKSRELTLMLLRESDEPFSRTQYTPGHITGTACVIHPDQSAVLLVHHRKLNRWLLPGGHIEELLDMQVADTARREAEEETGVQIDDGDPPLLVGIDVHGIPGRKKEPYHLHHDMIFRFQASSAGFVESEEVRGIAWCPLNRFDEFGLPNSIRHSVARSVIV